MNLTLVFLLLLAPFGSSSQAAGTGAIEGTVVIHDSSRPAADIRILLSRHTTPEEISAKITLETTADAAGRFSFRDLSLGRYTASSADYRFTYPPRGEYQLSLTVVAGQTARADLTVALTGSLRGRVFRPDGTPLTSGFVTASRVLYSGQQIILNSSSTGTIDSNGIYRIPYLEPREYYVTAYDSLRRRTYFPDSPDASKAKPVTVSEDAEATADIVFRPDPLVKVSGKISAESPDLENYEVTDFYMTRKNTRIRDDVPRLDYAATITGSPQTPERNVNVTFSDSGRQFEIQGVSAGPYDIFAVLSEKPRPPARTTQGTDAVMVPGPRLFARTEVEAGIVNVENVSLVARPGVAVTGRVLWNPPEKAASFSISISPTDNAPGAMTSAITGLRQFAGSARDGKLYFYNVPPGSYSLNVSGLPTGTYLSDIRQNGQSLGPAGLVVGTQSENSIEIVVNEKAATIRGSLQNRASAGLGTSVVLVPETALRWNTNLHKWARVNASGDFVLSNIAPGEYKLFAFERGPAASPESPEFSLRYETRGLPISIQPGATIEIQVPLISSP